MYSPVVVLTSGEEKKVEVSSSPTSTADDFMDCEVVNHGDVSTINRLCPVTECVTSSCIPQISSTKKSKPLSVKTIHNVDIKILKPFNIVLDLKMQLCTNSLIDKNDIMIIKDGKELRNSDTLTASDLQSKAFMLLRTSTATSVPISLKPQGIEGGVNKTLKVPLNMRVHQLKKQLFTSKFTTLRPESQRIIVSGKVLHDSAMVGDYLLQSMLNKANSTTQSTELVNGKPVVQPVATLYLSKTVNVKHEVDVEIPLTNGNVITCPIELSQPLSMLPKILNRRHFFPLPNDEFFYVFSLKVSQDSSLVDKSNSSMSARNMKKAIMNDSKQAQRQSAAFELVELDLNKSLLDYGFTQSTKKVCVEIARSACPPKLEDTRPSEFSDMLFIYLAFIAARRLKRQEEGLPMDEPGPIKMDLPIPIRIPLPGTASSSRISNSNRGLTIEMGDMSEDGPKPTTEDIKGMLEAMGVDSATVSSMMSNPTFIGIASGDMNSSGVVVSKKRSTPGSSAASSSAGVTPSNHNSSPSLTSGKTNALGQSNKKSTVSATNPSTTSSGAKKGGLFGGLKKGFLGGGKKDAK